jgi:hypothetical protein
MLKDSFHKFVNFSFENNQNLSEAIAKRKMSEDILNNISNDLTDNDDGWSLDAKLEFLKAQIVKLYADTNKK